MFFLFSRSPLDFFRFSASNCYLLTPSPRERCFVRGSCFVDLQLAAQSRAKRLSPLTMAGGTARRGRLHSVHRHMKRIRIGRANGLGHIFSLRNPFIGSLIARKMIIGCYGAWKGEKTAEFSAKYFIFILIKSVGGAEGALRRKNSSRRPPALALSARAKLWHFSTTSYSAVRRTRATIILKVLMGLSSPPQSWRILIAGRKTKVYCAKIKVNHINLLYVCKHFAAAEAAATAEREGNAEGIGERIGITWAVLKRCHYKCELLTLVLKANVFDVCNSFSRRLPVVE